MSISVELPATASEPAPAAAPAIAPLAESECDELARYLAAFPDETLSEQHWRRRMDLWWTSNPCFGSDSTRGWTIRTPGNQGKPGKLVGFFGIIPLGFQLAGRETVVYGSTTWRVDAGHRHNSLAAIGRVLRHTKASLLFVSTRSAALIKILQACKFVRLPRPAAFAGRVPSTMPLRIDGLLRMVARQPPGLLGRGIGALGTVSSLYPRLAAARLRFASRDLQVREVGRADQAFDALWMRSRTGYPTTNLRTSALLNWHCFASADHRKRLFGCYKGDALVGFAVMNFQSVRAGRLLVAQCLDLWTDRTEGGVPGATEALVAALVTAARQAGADLLELPAYASEIQAAARRGGFFPRQLTDRGEFVLGPREALAELASPAAYLCSLQGDSGL